MGTGRTKGTLLNTGTLCTIGVFLTGFGLLTSGGRLTNLGNLELGARGEKGAFFAIREDGTKGALRLKPEKVTALTLLIEGALGALGAGRKAKH